MKQARCCHSLVYFGNQTEYNYSFHGGNPNNIVLCVCVCVCFFVCLFVYHACVFLYIDTKKKDPKKTSKQRKANKNKQINDTKQR